MNVAICDAHSRYRAGCGDCARRSRAYLARRELTLRHTGEGFSRAVDHTARQLWELRANGWSLHYLAERTGLNFKHLWAVCSDTTVRHNKYVTLGTYHAVEAIYRELRDFPGPSTRARTWAAKRGYTPPEPPPMPEDYIDTVAVDRAVNGDRTVLADMTRADLIAAWDRLGRQGMPEAQRERHLRVGAQSIKTWRTSSRRAKKRSLRDRRGA